MRSPELRTRLLLPVLLILFYCTPEYKIEFNRIPFDFVYDIKQHGDSIYFSTSEKGLFRFHINDPSNIIRIGGRGKLPFRAFSWSDNGVLYAVSYYAGLHKLSGDTLFSCPDYRYPGWSMKVDDKGRIWVAGSSGIYMGRDEKARLFSRMLDAHDIAVKDESVFVAHENGISLFDIKSKKVRRIYDKGINYWSIDRYGDRFIAGGKEACMIIEGDSFRKIYIGPSENIVWNTDVDSSGNIFIASQKGLFIAPFGKKRAFCIGFKGECVKDVFVDSRDDLWTGSFD